jgi:hypothetical protein
MAAFNSASERKRRLRSRAKIHRWIMRTAASTLAYRGANSLRSGVASSRRIPSDSANSANKCALGRYERLFAGARIVGVVGFASPSESYHGRLQRNPHVTDLPLSRSDRARRGLVMEQTDSALNIGAAGTNARLNLRSNLDPLAINLARARTRIAR